MISLLNRSEKEGGIYTGLITTFTKIASDEPWFDASELKEATSSQISQVSIPANLYPNASTFNFVFDTNNHRFYVQTYSRGKTFSIRTALTLLDRLSQNLRVVKEFGEAKITLVQSKVGLSDVFSLPVIKRIVISIDKPNADIFDDDFDEKIEAYLEEIDGRRMTVILEAEQGRSLKPNPEVRRIGESALEHGFVRVEGRDATGKAARSTEDNPRTLQMKYDPDEISEQDAFRGLTGR
jgi:hypothetical protein